MIIMKTAKYILYIFLIFNVLNISGQEDKIPVSEMTREQIQNLSYEQLLALPFEDLVAIAQKLGISIDELLKMKTTVASKTALTPRETPGIISIITNEEIKNMGARDLVDVLRTVPGINFAYDDAGVIGIQMRGNWAHEGKVLLMIDGQEFNDLKYNTLQFGRHFDVNQIKRIEIIRGPGSALYGGNAELGVINIITFTGEELKKISVTGSYGMMTKKMGHEDLSIAAGTKVKDWDISLKSFLSKGNHSDQIYEYDAIYDFSKSGSGTQAINLNLGINNKNLSFRAIYDNYASDCVYAEPLPATYTDYYKNFAGELKYDWHVSNKLTITPKVNYRYNIPYYQEGWYANSGINRYTGNIIANYQVNNNISITGGAEYFTDHGKMLENTDTSLFDNGKRTVTYNTVSLFLESTIKTKIVNIVVGGRFDNHNVFGSAFAPRIGLTKVWDKFHLKLLYSGAFRSPSIGNLVFNTDIKPEKTYVLELEAGAKLNNNMFLTANVFNIKIKDPIVWFSTVDTWGYKNEDKTGTLGFELEYKLKYSWGYATLNYSYYQDNKNTVWDYDVPGDNSFIGAPKHKIAMNSGFYLGKYICLSPSFVYMGKSYFDPDADANNKISGKLLANCFINFINYKLGGQFPVELGVGISDVFNQKYPFIQSYRGAEKPYPGPSREFTFRFSFSFE
jgi:outer membrane receptor for ferrienterochelin and colicin